MIGQQFGTLAIEFQLLIYARVYFREVILVEVLVLQHVTLLQDFLFLQLGLGTEDEPRRVQVLVLGLYGLLLLLVLLFQGVDILVEGVDLLVKDLEKL